jgi:hypothetical protein
VDGIDGLLPVRHAHVAAVDHHRHGAVDVAGRIPDDLVADHHAPGEDELL